MTTTTSAAAPPSASPVVTRPAPRTAPVVLALAVVAGLAVGALTSFGQTVLGGTWLAGLTNAVAPWLVTSFVVGALARRGWVAALAGLLVCAGEVAGYYVTAELRGYPAGAASIVLWVGAGVLGGPLFGWAGRQWRTGTGRWRGSGAGLLVGCFVAEGVVTYAVLLHYGAQAVVSALVGVLLGVVLGRLGRQGRAVLRWSAVATVAGAAGFLALQLGLTELLLPDVPPAG